MRVALKGQKSKKKKVVLLASLNRLGVLLKVQTLPFLGGGGGGEGTLLAWGSSLARD